MFSDSEVAALSREKGFTCETGSNCDGKYILCFDEVNGKNLYVSLDGAMCENIAGKGKVIEKLTMGEVDACAADLEPFIPSGGLIIVVP